MVKENPNDEWIIDLRGYFPEMIRDSFTGEYFTDLVQGTRQITFRGSKSALDEYLQKMSSDESQFKIIGVMNKLDTLIEFIREKDFNQEFTGFIWIKDLFENRNFLFPEKIAAELVPGDQKSKFIESLKENPRRLLIKRPDVDLFINQNQENQKK